MERPSSDYMSISDLSKPRQTPLQIHLEKIDPSIIKHGTPTSRSHRRGYARQRTERDSSLFEISVLAFREIIFNRLWKNDKRFQNETEFCKHQWDILKPRKAHLIECAELLMELSKEPIRPCSEQVCTALVQASIKLQPSSLQRTSIAPRLWQKVLAEWQRQRGLKPSDIVDVNTMSADFVNEVLFPPTSSSLQNQQNAQIIPQQSQPTINVIPPPPAPQQPELLHPNFQINQQSNQASSSIAPPELQPQVHDQRLFQHVSFTGQTDLNTPSASSHGGSNSSSTHPSVPAPQSSSSSAPSSQPETFRERIAHLLTDERRFHAPTQVLERVHQFFKGPPQLDPAGFEGSVINAAISIPFPDIMDTDGWCTPVPDTSNPAASGGGQSSSSSPRFAPIQSCFMHVPILPSKRRFETETEVILLDDIRLAGQLNAKLWEEFSNGNIMEAISIVPTSATWFGKTELADWPCVVMSGLKFEQANGTDPSGKKYFEVHSYIAVYLGRDPLRQTQFVKMFQDLGISPAQNPENLFAGGNPHFPNNNVGQHHRWIAGFRRLFKTQGVTGGSGGSKGSRDRSSSPWKPSDDEDSIDPQFDDIYSILPPNKKPRLERVGRPSDMRAAWHHSKRRKTEDTEFSKLKDPDLNRKWGSDDDMSE